jgi:hypothetical protein
LNKFMFLIAVLLSVLAITPVSSHLARGGIWSSAQTAQSSTGSVATSSGLASAENSMQTANDIGCHEYEDSSGAWRSTDCLASKVASSLPKPVEGGSSTLQGVSSNSLVSSGYSSVYIANPGFTFETDPTVGNNGFSIQANTNGFTGNNGHLDAVQFTFQNSPNWLYLVWAPWAAVCVWNIDVTTQNYQTACVNTPTQTLDYGYSATVYGSASGGTLTAKFCTGGACWSVTAPDKYGLSSNWTQLNGGILGIGNGSQAQFDFGAEVAYTVSIRTSIAPATLISQTSRVATTESNNLSYSSSSVSCVAGPAQGYVWIPWVGWVPIPEYYDCQMQSVSVSDVPPPSGGVFDRQWCGKVMC